MGRSTDAGSIRRLHVGSAPHHIEEHASVAAGVHTGDDQRAALPARGRHHVSSEAHVMKRLALLPIAALALAACSDPATGPAPEGLRPVFAVSPGLYTGTIFDENAPSGTHLQTGSIECRVLPNLSVRCSQSIFELAGVGHTNVDVLLTADYAAIVDCFNPGDPSNKNNPIESHETTFSAEKEATIASLKNGRLAVPPQQVDPEAVAQGCPNPNWEPTIRPGTLELLSFTYTVTFEGYENPYIVITQP
jgi:hypothetical protein